MAWKKTDDTYYGEIASAIRAKNGTNNTYQPPQMANAINALPEIVDEDAALVLIDWEGTLLRSYTREEVMALTELPNPTMLPNYAYADHEWLVFQEWNWSVNGIKDYCQKYGYCPLYVGAIYDTIDHLNHIDHEKGIAKYGSSGANYIFNGDSGINFFSLCRGYNQGLFSSTSFNNQYSLKHMSIPSDFSGQKIKFSSCWSLATISIPETATNLYSSYNFNSCNGLKFLSLPKITSIGELFIANNASLLCYNIPKSVTLIANDGLKINRSVQKIELHDTIASIGALAFQNCNRLHTIVIKGKPILLNVNAFQVKMTTITRKFYVPQANLSWFSTETNWADIYSQYQFATIEDNIEYLERLGFNVDEYKEATP